MGAPLGVGHLEGGDKRFLERRWNLRRLCVDRCLLTRHLFGPSAVGGGGPSRLRDIGVVDFRRDGRSLWLSVIDQRWPSDEAGQPSAKSTSGQTPEVPTFVGTLTEYQERIAACLRSKGFHAVANPLSQGGGVTVNNVGSQADVVAAAQNQCQKSLGQPPNTRSVTHTFIVRMYQWNCTQKCLQQHGYPVTPPSSLDTYEAQFNSGPSNAYDAISAKGYQLSTKEWNKINDECPQTPPLTPIPGEPFPSGCRLVCDDRRSHRRGHPHWPSHPPRPKRTDCGQGHPALHSSYGDDWQFNQVQCPIRMAGH